MQRATFHTNPVHYCPVVRLWIAVLLVIMVLILVLFFVVVITRTEVGKLVFLFVYKFLTLVFLIYSSDSSTTNLSFLSANYKDGDILKIKLNKESLRNDSRPKKTTTVKFISVYFFLFI